MPTIQEIFEARAAKRPDAIAIFNYGRSCVLDEINQKTTSLYYETKKEKRFCQRKTYRELNEQANQLAHVLLERGLQPGSPVGICLETSTDTLIVILAVLKARGMCVPINVRNVGKTKTLLKSLMEAKEPAFLVGLEETFTQLPDHTVPQVIALEKMAPFSSDPHHLSNPKIGANADDKIYIMTTSGTSTGIPRVFAIKHQGILKWLPTSWLRSVAMHESDRTLLFSPEDFDASWADKFMGLLIGGAVVVPPADEIRKDSDSFIDFINYARVTAMTLAPDVLVNILNSEKAIEHPVKVQSTGDRFKVELLRKKKNLTFHNAYGPSQTGLGFSEYKLTEEDMSLDNIPICKDPCDGNYFYLRQIPLEESKDEKSQTAPMVLIKPESGRDYIGSDKCIYELVIGGDGITDGYISDTTTSLDTSDFIRDPDNGSLLFPTGDAVSRKQGKLYYEARIGDLAKINGKKINPFYVAHWVGEFPKIQAAVVMKEETKDRDDILVCYYEIKKGETFELAELLKFLKENIEDYAIPGRFFVVPQMPLNANGKIDRKRLKEFSSTTPLLRNKVLVKPRNPVEEKLLQICCELLGITASQLSVTDKLSDFGFDSPRIIRLNNRIKNPTTGFGITLSPREFQERLNTIEAIAQHIQWEKTVTVIQEKAGERNVWLLHEVAGKTDVYSKMKGQISGNLYGLNAPEYSWLGAYHSVEEMADYQIAIMKIKQPQGPYTLVGYSFGAGLAHAIAEKLEKNGDAVNQLFLLDSAPYSSIQALSNKEFNVYLSNTMAKLLVFLSMEYDVDILNAVPPPFIEMEMIKQADPAQQLKYVFTELLHKVQDKKAELSSHIYLILYHMSASLEYEHTGKIPLKCPVVLFYTPEDLLKIFPGAERDWLNHCTNLTSFRVQGDHTSVMSNSKYAQEWMRVINTTLSSFDKEAKKEEKSIPGSAASEMQKMARENEELREKIRGLEKRNEGNSKKLKETYDIYDSLLEMCYAYQLTPQYKKNDPLVQETVVQETKDVFTILRKYMEFMTYLALRPDKVARSNGLDLTQIQAENDALRKIYDNLRTKNLEIFQYVQKTRNNYDRLVDYLGNTCKLLGLKQTWETAQWDNIVASEDVGLTAVSPAKTNGIHSAASPVLGAQSRKLPFLPPSPPFKPVESKFPSQRAASPTEPTLQLPTLKVAYTLHVPKASPPTISKMPLKESKSGPSQLPSMKQPRKALTYGREHRRKRPTPPPPVLSDQLRLSTV